MAFAVQSSNPSCYAQLQKPNKQQANLDIVAEVSAGLGVVSEIDCVDAGSNDEPLFSDYWQRFSNFGQEADDAKLRSTSEVSRLMPVNKAVKML